MVMMKPETVGDVERSSVNWRGHSGLCGRTSQMSAECHAPKLVNTCVCGVWLKDLFITSG